MNILPYCIIEKELIPSLKLSKSKTEFTKKETQLQNNVLTRAAKLGNLLKNKVSIYFEDNDGNPLRVTTTIWAITQEYIILKNSVLIPRNRILYVE